MNEADRANPWRALLETSSDLTLEVEVCSGHCLHCNASVANILGRQPDELIGRALVDFVHPNDLDAVQRLLSGAPTAAEPAAHVIRFRHADDSWRWLEATAQVYRTAAGSRVGMRARDITEHRPTVSTLIQLEDQLRALFRQRTALTVLLATDGTLTQVNQGALEYSGVERREVVGRPFWDAPWWSHDADLQARVRAAVEAAAEGEPQAFEASHPRPDGSLGVVDFHLNPLFDEDGRVELLLAESVDITDRVEIDAQLSAILNSAMDGIITVNAEQRVVLFNRAAERMFGQSAREVVGQPLDQFLPERFRAAHHSHLDKFAATGKTSRRMGELGKVFALRSDGREFPVEASISRVTTEDRTLLTVILRDVSVRLRAEQERQELLSILDETRNEIYVIEADSLRFRYANRAAREALGYTAAEIAELSCADVSSLERDELATVFDSLRRGERETAYMSTIQYRKDGTRYPIDVYYQGTTYESIPSILAVTVDATETRKMERKLVEAEQLASISTLAAGIAHDVGTPLNVISGYADLIERGAQDDTTRTRARIVKEQIGRITDLVQTLLNISRPHAPRRARLDLERSLDHALLFLADRFAERGIKVERDFRPLPTVFGDSDRLERVLLNLLANAVDAMPTGGNLHIRLAPAAVGYNAEISIRDTGSGIPSDELSKIFEPYYSTKERGQGTGLGLFAAKSIVLEHGGSIEVESALGEGTEFRIQLPVPPP